MFENSKGFVIHDKPEEYEGMRKAGQLSATILDAVNDIIDVGVTTNEINNFCHKMTLDAGAIPAPLNYPEYLEDDTRKVKMGIKGFPKSICTSVNHVVCHGIPNDVPLKNGDIVNVDVTSIVDGWHGDTSRMFLVGKPKILAKRLVEVTYEAMMRGIELVKPGCRLGDIGHAIQSFVESKGYSVVRDYCGHGLGKTFHTLPNVLHYGSKNTGDILEEGMFFTIEPMVNVGKFGTKLSSHDGWTVTTKDRSLSGQFEHSLAVTKDGFEIFTQSPKGIHHP